MHIGNFCPVTSELKSIPPKKSDELQEIHGNLDAACNYKVAMHVGFEIEVLADFDFGFNGCAMLLFDLLHLCAQPRFIH